MGRKAQAELALILGLFVVAIVVGLYAYSSVTPPSAQPSTLTEEQKAVDTFVKDSIRRASVKTLGLMYNQGGYADTSSHESIAYGGGTIPYWQKCSSTNVPDVEHNFEKAVEDAISSSLPDRMDIAGKVVVFDKSQLSADAMVYDNSMTLNVRIPTTVEGQPMPQPYTIDLSISMGRIYDFAKNFAAFQAKFRALDYNLMRLISRTNPDDCWLPTKGVEFDASFSKSWTELRDCMEQLIVHNLAHTYEWQKPALRGGVLPKDMHGESWLFEIVKSDGTWGQYKELELEFYYGGEKEGLSRNDPELFFGTSPDPVQESGETVSMFGFTIGPMLDYDVKYDVSYPVVVSVWDPLFERSFRFTTFVNIRGSEISNNCQLASTAPSDYDQRCIIDATEDMRLSVVDHNGIPLSGVDVWYDGCGPWRVFNGDLQSSIRKATDSELRLIDEFSGSEYKVCLDSDELRSRTMTLPIKKAYQINFYEVEILRSPYRINTITKTDDLNITVIFNRTGNPCMNSSQEVATNYGLWGGVKDTGWANLYPTVQYHVSVNSEGGSIDASSFVDDGSASSLNVYAPRLSGITASDAQGIRNLYSSCGMAPVSVDYYGSKVGCSL